MVPKFIYRHVSSWILLLHRVTFWGAAAQKGCVGMDTDWDTHCANGHTEKNGSFLDMFCIKHHQTIHFLGSKWVNHFEQSLWTKVFILSSSVRIGAPRVQPRCSIPIEMNLLWCRNTLQNINKRIWYGFPRWHERITFRSPRPWVDLREQLQKIFYPQITNKFAHTVSPFGQTSNSICT